MQFEVIPHPHPSTPDAFAVRACGWGFVTEDRRVSPTVARAGSFTRDEAEAFIARVVKGAAHDRYHSDFTDDGRWYVADLLTGRKIKLGSRREGSFVLAEIFDDPNPNAVFDRILDELGPLKES